MNGNAEHSQKKLPKKLYAFTLSAFYPKKTMHTHKEEWKQLSGPLKMKNDSPAVSRLSWSTLTDPLLPKYEIFQIFPEIRVNPWEAFSPSSFCGCPPQLLTFFYLLLQVIFQWGQLLASEHQSLIINKTCLIHISFFFAVFWRMALHFSLKLQHILAH